MNFDLISLILSIVWLCFVFFFVILRNFFIIIIFFQEMIVQITESKKEIMVGISIPLTIVSIFKIISSLSTFL